jgi:hypothetical protein
MESDIVDAWTTARERGETVALMAHTNETVRHVNRVCQRQLIHTGRLHTGRPSLTVGGQTLYEGDEVVTRLNKPVRPNRPTENGQEPRPLDH